MFQQAPKNSEIEKKLRFIKSQFIAKHCPIYQQLHYHEVIASQINELEKMLQIKSSDKIFENMTKKTLQKAAEKFIYLTSCSETVRSWFFFYENLFTKQPPAQIIVALNRLLKGRTTPENMSMKTLARKLFSKLDNVLSLKYADIMNMSTGIDSSLINRLDGMHST